MSNALLPRASGKSTPITLITEKEYSAWLKRQPVRSINWLKAQDFSGKPGSFCILPDTLGKPASVIAGISDPPSLWDLGGLPSRLPAGTYHIDWKGPTTYHEWFALGWALGSYRFTRYRKNKKQLAQLALSKGSDAAKVARYEYAINLARDLINTPAEDM